MNVASQTTTEAPPQAAEPTAPAPRTAQHRTVIEPPRGWVALNLRELWRYRELLLLLIGRDISARYRQTVIGFGWAVIKPALSVAIFTVIFGIAARLDSEGIQYPLFALAGLVPWLYFASCLGGSTTSVVAGGALVTKVYFPRLILPLASLGGGLIEFAIQFLLLLGLMLWYGRPFTATVLLAPVFVTLCMIAALSVGLWLTALNVKYRDVGQMVPFFTQAWMWLTPIVYSSTIVPESWRLLYGLNPMVGVVVGFRWAMLGGVAPDWAMMTVSFTVVAVLFVSGLYYFRRTEETFADVI